MKKQTVTIYLPIVKKVFWKLYWVVKWEKWDFVGGKIYKNGVLLLGSGSIWISALLSRPRDPQS